MSGYIISAFLVIIALIIFVYQNTSLVTIHLFTWVSKPVSLSLVVLASILIGASIAFLVDGIRYYKVAKQVKSMKAHNRENNKPFSSEF